MAEPDQAIWRKILAHLRAQHPDLWRQWFEEIEAISLDKGVFRLRVHRPLHLRYLQRECVKAFAEAAQTVTGRLLTVRFLGDDDSVSANGDVSAGVHAGNAGVNGDAAAGGDADAAGHAAAFDGAAPTGPNGKLYGLNGASGNLGGGGSGTLAGPDGLVLIPDYTFDNFVIGPGNRLAHAAAVAIGQNPGRAYNPMFIHGGVGLGKTHLLQAVCQRILEADPRARILYISCEDFVTRFMDAVQAGQMSGFRHHFRDVDMLVIDDIHFLAKRDRTQEEFFHTFNSLHQTNRQIILSSDAAPDEIPHLEERLVSRFKWGLVAEIEAPDYETRVAIVKQKAKGRGVELPDDVSCLIAARFDSNIRELEGALTKLQMQSTLDNCEITLDLARKALGANETAPTGRATIETIVTAVTAFYDVTLSNLQSKRRQRSIALPRQVCMYLARRYTRYSLEEIGGYFGGRDHTTVLHAVRMITAHRDRDNEMDKTLTAIESKLVAAKV